MSVEPYQIETDFLKIKFYKKHCWSRKHCIEYFPEKQLSFFSWISENSLSDKTRIIYNQYLVPDNNRRA